MKATLKHLLLVTGIAAASFSFSDELAGAQCVDKAASKMKLYSHNHANPELFQNIITYDMMLADMPEAQVVFADALTKPVQLTPMVQQIRTAIIEKHPAIAEFLCQALEQDLIPTLKPDNEMIDRILHHTYLLEILTQEMANDWQFMVAVEDHLLSKREAFGISRDFMESVMFIYGLTGELFEPIKTKTMDWVQNEYGIIRERGYITDFEVEARRKGLQLNILEAMITDKDNGYINNAKAGIGLAIIPAQTLRVSGEERFIEYVVSQEWASLYQTWNMAFVTGHLDHLNLIMPKLLIPSVIDAEPNDYLFNRVLSLWTTVNFALFASVTQPDVPLANAEQLATIWGDVNVQYANDLVLKTTGAPVDYFSYLLGMTFSDLWAQLKMALIYGGQITVEEAEQLTEMLAAQ